MRRRLRKREILLILAAVLLVLAGVYLGAQWLEQKNANPEPEGDYQQRYADQLLSVNGVQYRKLQNLTTILLIGVDRDSDQPIANNYRNGGQADFLRLLLIDPSQKTITQLEIDRDTMTPITILGVLGNRAGTRTAQISLSHGFGDGKEQSSQLTAEAVSKLLLDMPIKYYIALNMDGIGELNDALGGVTVTLEDDFSSVDPAMTKGSTITLQGGQAETFVRSRMSVGAGTNEARMARQQQFISQASDILMQKIREDQEFIGVLYDALEPYMVTNMSRSQMVNEAWRTRNYDRQPLARLEGEHLVGADGFMEYHVDKAALEQTVLTLLYQKLE